MVIHSNNSGLSQYLPVYLSPNKEQLFFSQAKKHLSRSECSVIERSIMIYPEVELLGGIGFEGIIDC